jgi:hypothetical protein
MTQDRRSAEWDLTLRPSEYDGALASCSAALRCNVKMWTVGDKPILSCTQYLSYKPRLKDRGIHCCK